MDESGISTVPTKLRKVIAVKGRSASKIVSGERGITITVVCCMSAGGHFVPPAMIFPRKRRNEILLNGAPLDTVMLCSDSGFINSELFLEWLKHFQQFAKSSADDPTILVLDNHASHISLTGVEFCRQHSIYLLSLPSHSSHKTQPLDVCFYGPLKVRYEAAAESWMSMHPGRAITPYQVSALFNEAYTQCASVGNANKAFATTGIWSFNRNIFTDIDFLASRMTDRPLEQEVINPGTAAAAEASTSANHVGVSELVMTVESIPMAEQTPTAGQSTVGNQLGVHDLATSPSRKQYVSPSMIRPLPKCGEQKRRRVAMRSEVLTATPVKIRLAAKNEEIEKKKLRIEARKLKLKTGGNTQKKMKHNKKQQNVSCGDDVNKLAKPKKCASADDVIEGQKETKMAKSKIKSKVVKNNPKSKPAAKNRKSPAIEASAHATQISNGSVVSCPACAEPFNDPPIEEWIQCSKCKAWWHEDCTAYESGVFICDLLNS